MTFPSAPAPAVLLVGFLGSGKTTFLRNLLPLLETKGLEPFVVINDYENASIDASSLKSLVEDVTPINGNCVCCDSIHELINTLLVTPPKANRVVLIEANGTTDPFSLIEHLTAHAELRSKFYPLIQIGVIDIKRWQRRHWHNELEHLQALSASHLIYTRLEEAKAERISEVRSDLEWMNSRAVETTPEMFSDELALLVRESRETSPVKFTVARSRNRSSVFHSQAQDHQHAHHQLAHAFVAVQLNLPTQVAGKPFYEWLRQIPTNVLRIKGIVRMMELPDMHFIFQRTDDAPQQPTMFPLPIEPTMPPCAVLIGVRLDEMALREQMESMLGTKELAA